MKNYATVICISLVLGTASCMSSKYVVVAPSIPKLRIASEEYQFIDGDKCKEAAYRYNRRINHTSTLPSDANNYQDIFTFRKKPWLAETKEVRFIKGPKGADTGKLFTYLEIPQVAGADDGKTISDFVDELVKLGFKVSMFPVKDSIINGKTTWRAILYGGGATGQAMKYRKQAAELFDFGIIINPPYPP